MSEKEKDQAIFTPYIQFWMNTPIASHPLKYKLVDFQKPWWHVALGEWKSIMFFSIFFAVELVLVYATPFALSVFFNERNIQFFMIYMGARILISALNSFVESLMFRFEFSLGKSIRNSATQFFLEVDPVYHSLRQTGKITSKIEAGVSAYIQVLQNLLRPVFNITIGVISSFILIAGQNSILAIGVVMCLAILSGINVWWAVSHSINTKKALIHTRDQQNIVYYESLQQTPFIRMLFATRQALTKYFDTVNERGKVNIGSWFGAFTRFNTITSIYLFVVLGVSYVLFLDVVACNVESIVALGLITTFLISTGDILRLGRLAAQFIDNYNEITDLWKFIREYGSRSFPVLEEHTITDVNDPGVNENQTSQNLTLSSSEFSFSYDKQEVFVNHRIFIQSKPSLSHSQLYGLIGPSGTGKSTLTNILGGQLKPDEGNIFINGIDIYAVNEDIRRTLIVMQPQTPTALRGTAQYNLRFGITSEKESNEGEEIDILKRVGLWELLEQKSGLKTMIGEGGVNLSGGQRQRLNFANSYLRWKNYHPKVVLIDEPTSSLDEISEKAVTDMIFEMSLTSLTIVIAHRLNTLNKAVGLLDSSLFFKEKEIKPYTRQELLYVSEYYQNVLSGKAQLEA